MEQYKDAKVFKKDEFDTIVEDKIEIPQIGKVEISEKEISVLRLQPKFAVLRKLITVEMKNDLELGFAKARYQILAEIREKLEEGEDGKEEEVNESLEERMEEEEAKSRQVFDPIERTFDYRKKRATDLKENCRVTLPKCLPTTEEACMETRRKAYLTRFNTHKEANCNQWGDQATNLTEEESQGLKSLQKRIKNKEIVILKTDKTGKFCVAEREAYLEMGREQIAGDIEIDRRENTEQPFSYVVQTK